MKIYALIGALVIGVASLKADREHGQVKNLNHQLFGISFCCRGADREVCGKVFDSCCQKGFCTTTLGVAHCPDNHQFKC